MVTTRSAVAAGAIVLFALGACSRGEPVLMNLRASGNGPDEFAIVPPKPLEMPTSLAALPEPTPGGANRTDATPQDDAIVALGGRAQGGAGIPAADAAIVAQVGRYGVTPGIRQTLAAEDLEFRRDNNGRILERLFNVNVYFRAYASQSLDQHAELARWRRAGARNVSAPPPLAGE